MIVHSRVDENQTWTGTVTKIDRENARTGSNNVYNSSGDGMTQDENGMVDNTMDGAEYSGEEDTTNVIGGADGGEAGENDAADTQEAGSAEDGEVQP